MTKDGKEEWCWKKLLGKVKNASFVFFALPESYLLFYFFFPRLEMFSTVLDR